MMASSSRDGFGNMARLMISRGNYGWQEQSFVVVGILESIFIHQCPCSVAERMVPDGTLLGWVDRQHVSPPRYSLSQAPFTSCTRPV